MERTLFDHPENNLHISIQEQVRRHVRTMIVSGKLMPGQKLPAVHELAKRWQINSRTVNLGLRALNREGMLTSVPRVGTYVTSREERLEHVGVFYGKRPGGQNRWGSLQFLQSLELQIEEVLESQGMKVSTWVDTRSQTEQEELPWEVLQRAAAERKIQGLIVIFPAWQRLEWLKNLPIPTALFTSALLPNSVHQDLRQFVDLSLERLLAQGCRSAGFIYPGPIESEIGAVVSYFIDRATDLGLEVQNEWVKLLNTNSAPETRRPAPFGYWEFRELWAQRRRPEGFVVGNDLVMLSVVNAVLELGVDVPRELKIVSLKNKGVELFCPFPISHVVSDEREIAQALIEQVQIQFRGDRCGVATKWTGMSLDSWA